MAVSLDSGWYCLIWHIKLFLFFKTFPHIAHASGFSCVCIALTCLLQLDLSLNTFPHFWQINSLPAGLSKMKSEGPTKIKSQTKKKRKLYIIKLKLWDSWYKCLLEQCFFMCLLISVFRTCFSQLGHVAFFCSPKCSILMCLLQLDWWEKYFPHDRHSKFLSSCFWQSWLAPSRRAAANKKTIESQFMKM